MIRTCIGTDMVYFCTLQVKYAIHPLWSTRFWNNLHQVRSQSRNVGKPSNLNVLESKKTKLPTNVRYALEPVRNIPDNWKTWIFEYSRLKIERPFEFDATIYFLLYILFLFIQKLPLYHGANISWEQMFASRNNLHQVRSQSRNVGKPSNLNVLESKKTKLPTNDSKNRLRPYMPEGRES
jgi:hypothetical protein